MAADVLAGTPARASSVQAVDCPLTDLALEASLVCAVWSASFSVAGGPGCGGARALGVAPSRASALSVEPLGRVSHSQTGRSPVIRVVLVGDAVLARLGVSRSRLPQLVGDVGVERSAVAPRVWRVARGTAALVVPGAPDPFAGVDEAQSHAAALPMAFCASVGCAEDLEELERRAD